MHAREPPTPTPWDKAKARPQLTPRLCLAPALPCAASLTAYRFLSREVLQQTHLHETAFLSQVLHSKFTEHGKGLSSWTLCRMSQIWKWFWSFPGMGLVRIEAHEACTDPLQSRSKIPRQLPKCWDVPRDSRTRNDPPVSMTWPRELWSYCCLRLSQICIQLHAWSHPKLQVSRYSWDG